MYVMYGKTPSGDKEGTASDATHKFYFRIKDLVKGHSKLDDPKVQEAIGRQEKEINANQQVK